MKESKIEWTNDTWNPWHGCYKLSPGCKNCYMYRDKNRWGKDGREIIRSSASIFNSPLKSLKGPLVFTCSWSDFFIDWADDWRTEAWEIIRKTPHLTYQILTKRPENIAKRLPKDWGDGWKNVWLGVSIESQDYDYRADELRKIPASIRFISAEPLLGELILNLKNFNWVITGGESGPGFREAKKEWFELIRLQCWKGNVAYFHKQNGGNKKIDGAWGGRELNGKIYHQFPSSPTANPMTERGGEK